MKQFIHTLLFGAACAYAGWSFGFEAGTKAAFRLVVEECKAIVARRG